MRYLLFAAVFSLVAVSTAVAVPDSCHKESITCPCKAEHSDCDCEAAFKTYKYELLPVVLEFSFESAADEPAYLFTFTSVVAEVAHSPPIKAAV